MMKNRIVGVVLFVVIFAVAFQSVAQKRPDRWSVEVAQSFIKRFPDPDSIHWKGQSNHFSWQAGYIMFAMEKLYKSTGDSAYFKYIKRYVDQQVDDKGNIPDFKNDALDNFLPGYAILFMYEQTGLEKYKIAANKIRHGFDHYPRTSDGLFWHGAWAKNQAWVDGVFMGQIFLARYASLLGDKEFAFNEVVKQITLIAGHCQKANGLLLHGWDESKMAGWANKSTGLAAEVWSEGLGWYAVLIADVFDYLPESHPGYGKLREIHKKLCEGIRNSQDPKTGLWCQVVDKCGEPGNWNETSGTGMFIYLLEKSINSGYISASEYRPVVDKAYRSLITKAKMNNEGFIDLLDCSSIGIQKDYKAYIDKPKEISTFAAFGSFILGTNCMENDAKKKN
jgi:rhamnogalacturonyl hydrolase YesR